MAPSSLYLKYRPKVFSDLLGQEVILETIVRQIEKDRLSHAYLFSGPKGSGKTTLARLIAKAVNCKKRTKGNAEPCNDCQSCKEISFGRSLDVVELDAASHTGVADVAEIRESVKFVPHGGKMRVFVIDEVHMLSKGAFNALLKTLEEPPVSSMFILATTEISKVPATIRSRCQEFHLKRAKVSDLASYISRMVSWEKIKIEDDAIKTIANVSDGSFRDAAAILEQVLGAGVDTIRAEDVRKLLGLASDEIVEAYLHALSKKHLNEALHVLFELSDKGVDAADFLRAITLSLRRYLLFVSENSEDLSPKLSENERKSFENLRKVWDASLVLRLLEKLLNLRELMRLSPLPTLPLEMVTVEWCGRAEGNEETKKRSNEVKENKKNATNINTSLHATSSPVTSVPVAKALSRLDQEVWNDILKLVKAENHSLYAILREAIVLGETADGVAVAVRFRFHGELLGLSRHREILGRCVTKILGREAGIVVEVKPEAFSAQEEELLKFAQELL